MTITSNKFEAPSIQKQTLCPDKLEPQVQPPSLFEDRIYATFTDGINFKDQLQEAQSKDLLISDAIKHINQTASSSTGRLK